MSGPRRHSRHTFSVGKLDDDDQRYLAEREPYRFKDLDDNIRHLASDGDTWSTLANRYYAGAESPSWLWWAIADFQPEPVVDPTIALSVGTVVVIPSLRTVLEIILDESRRPEAAT